VSPTEVRRTSGPRPDVVLVLADDMGYSDIGCYGGEIRTPHLDRLAQNGLRWSQFYNTARCSPSRASLLTGLHPHQAGIGILVDDDTPDGYPGALNNRCVTIAEVLGADGYATYLSGKWHMSSEMETPNSSWPTRRGFQHVFGTLEGAGSFYDPRTLSRGEERVEHEAQSPDFYYTDAINDTAAEFVRGHHAERPDQPLFLYVAHVAPHWPLQAPAEDIADYRGSYDEGWDVLRARRAERLVQLGVLQREWPLSDRDPDLPNWTDTEHREWEARRMEVYAAQVQRMDAGIGRLVQALHETGRLDNTLFLFLSDNGGCAEELPPVPMDLIQTTPLAQVVRAETRDGRPVRFGNSPEIEPGDEDTYASYGRAWANLSNTPFREYKHWVHEGGIATPLIVHWPAGALTGGGIRHDPHQLPDIMATVLEATGTTYPDRFHGRDVLPAEGASMLSELPRDADSGRMLFWEHEGNAAVRRGPWKLVRKYPGDWELYDVAADRTELTDLAPERPELVAELAEAYDAWAARCDVIPRDRVLEDYRRRGRYIP
jgi:arylsulfatase A-like enzyme